MLGMPLAPRTHGLYLCAGVFIPIFERSFPGAGHFGYSAPIGHDS